MMDNRLRTLVILWIIILDTAANDEIACIKFRGITTFQRTARIEESGGRRIYAAKDTDEIACIKWALQGCVFYSRNGHDAESDGVRFIRVREDLDIGGEVLHMKAFPRNSIKIKGLERSSDANYFRLKETNATHIQVLLEKSLDDLVDRDIPQNLLKFKIQCNNMAGRMEESSFLTVTVYVEDINDHAPKFLGAPYSINVDESTPVGSTIYSGISAFDRDKPNTPNSDVQFLIAAQEYSGGPYFSLDSPHRPSLVLKRRLDYDEGIRQFEVIVTAADRGAPQKLTNTTVKIMVMDADDLPPKFTEGVYRTRVTEFSPLTGDNVRIPLNFTPPILAKDQDSLNASMYYDLISGNERQLFWVNPNTGVLYLDKEIDLEEESLPGNTFVLQLEARQVDSPLKRAVARIEIEVMDLNDNPPEFEVDLYNISIVENLPTGFSVLQVSAIDRDQGENAEFLYQIHEETPPGAFMIDPRSGWLTVRDQAMLDREERQSVTMEIRAVEKTKPYDKRDVTSGQVSVEITLLDSNDNTPEFEMGNLYEFKVNIDAEVGHTVGYVKANDPDEGKNGLIMYELQRPRASGVIPFKLDSKTGALTVAGPLSIGRIALFVEASDQPTNPSERRFSLAVVTIEIVRHKNEIVLDFIGSPYEFWVGADVPIGTSVGQIRTTVDYDMEGVVMYDLLHSYSEGVPFAVEERSGTVTVIRRLEEFNRKDYEFEAVAAHESYMNRHRLDKNFGQLVRRTQKSQKQVTRDGQVFEIEEGAGTASQNMLVTNVTIHIVGDDDARNILMRGTGGDPIEFHVRENSAGALIGQLLYTNKSNPVTKELTKEIVTPTPQVTQPSAVFAKRIGRVMSSTKFNRKKLKFAESPKATVRRNRDTNTDTSFFVSVSPMIFYNDTLGDVPIRPSLSSRRQSRQTDERSYGYNMKFNSNLDPEEAQRLDSGKSSRKSRSTFSRRFDNGAAKRNASHNVPLSRKYRHWSTTVEPFSSSGQPPVMRTTRIRGGYSTTTSSTTPVIPILISSAASVTHDNVLVLNNSDTSRKKVEFEPHRGLRFIIANQQDVTDMIAITNEGILMTLKGLDREVRDVYRLTIIAEYSKGVVSGAGIYQVTIYVDDENDNAPTFNQIAYNGIISENCAKNTNVLLNYPIMVSDKDIGENAEFTVTLFGEGSNLFALELVNSTDTNQIIAAAGGMKNVEKSFMNLQMMFMDTAMMSMPNTPHYILRYIGPQILDRERETFYNLKMIARDKGGLKSEVKLGIMIADVNDNAPVFDKIAVFKNVGIEILEHPHHMEVYFVEHVSEEDKLLIKSQKNKPLSTVKFETSSPVGFMLSKDRVKESRVNIGAPRQLNTTHDRRRSLLSRKSELLSRQKRRDSPSPLFAIKESVPVGISILKITATDEDFEANSQIFYDIVSETFIPDRISQRQVNLMKFFSIDRLSGEFKINRPLPAQSELHLNISARDIDGLADHAIIRFKVLDVNDHAPVFEKSWYTFDLDEGTYVDHVIGKIEATDEDFGLNSEIAYALQSQEKLPFVLSATTGVISISGTLDREERTTYEFKVMASDGAPTEDRLYSLVDIEINVLDINDNAPEFTGYDELYQSGLIHGLQSPRKLSSFNFYEKSEEHQLEFDRKDDSKIPVYRAYLNRKTEPGTLVKHITATDNDFAGNGNGLIMYAIVQSRLPYMFDIDSREGVITTVSPLNKIRGYEHLNLTIIASDLGSPSLSSTAMVLINLQGEEVVEEEFEKPELFTHKYYEIEIVENNVTPLRILQMNISNSKEMLRWLIVDDEQSNLGEIFGIDQNGTLWIEQSLDREYRDLYKFKIRAERITRGGRNAPTLTYPITGDRLHGLSNNEARIIVHVLDDNDNAPIFRNSGRPIVSVIPNTANFGYPVTTVDAIDDDADFNSDIRYMLLNEPSNLFGIDPLTGRIRVLGSISQDNQRVFGFDVKATDRQGAEDGRSSICNVFVYVLDENRQVRVVLAGTPVDVEKEVDNLTKIFSDATELDVRVRILEPHSGGVVIATDVYLYAVDPKTNAVVDMDDLQSMMTSIDMDAIYPPLSIIELPRLGGPKTFTRSIYGSRYGALNGSELASIILAIVIFAAGLTTTICVICIRQKRRRRLPPSHSGLAYTISKTPSSMRTVTSKSTNNSSLNMSSGRPRLYSENFSARNSYRDRDREYIDVPLPQSVLNSNYNLMDHDSGCLRFNQLRSKNTTIDASATSLHSSGRDSGLDLSRELSGSPARQPPNNNLGEKLNAEWELWKEHELSQRKKCICSEFPHPHTHHEPKKKNPGNGDESSDSYEDSLKDLPLNRRTSLPRNPDGLQRTGANPLGQRGVRHSFSGVRDDLVQNSPGPLNRTRFPGTRNSMTDLEERLRNIGITFHEPFILNNSRC